MNKKSVEQRPQQLYDRIREILQSARLNIARSVNTTQVMANWLIGRVSGVRLHDYGCTLKAYRREFLEPVRLYGEMHRFIPIYARWSGARVTELVVNHHPRREGQSKYGIMRTFKVVLDLLTVKFLGDYSTKPLYFFGGMGFVLGLAGTAMAVTISVSSSAWIALGVVAASQAAPKPFSKARWKTSPSGTARSRAR